MMGTALIVEPGAVPIIQAKHSQICVRGGQQSSVLLEGAIGYGIVRACW